MKKMKEMMNNAYVNGTSALKEDSKVIEFRVVEQKKQPKNSNYVANYKVGEKQEVYPFRSTEDLQKMNAYFEEKGQERNRMMFIVGINVGLRAGDLLTLTWDKIIEDGKVVDGVTVKEEKTGKFRIITVSIAGGVLHNIGQVLVAVLVLHTVSVAWYVLVLWFTGIAAGAVIGIIGGLLCSRLKVPLARLLN